MKKIGFIGAGNMGGALASAVAKSGAEVLLADKDTKKAEALAKEISALQATSTEVISNCDMVFLGVKPQILPAVAEELRTWVEARGEKLCLVSHR